MFSGFELVVSMGMTLTMVVLVFFLFRKKKSVSSQSGAMAQPKNGCPLCRVVDMVLYRLLLPCTLGVTLTVVFWIGWFEGVLYCVPLLLLFTVYWFISFRTVATTDRAVKTMFGRPYATTESGLCWVPYLIGDLDPRPTIIQTLDFTEHRAGVVTRASKELDENGAPVGNRIYGSITLGADVTFIFQYPKGDALMRAVVLLPRERDKLIDLFEEPVLDAVRTTGGNVPWINLVLRRAHFAEQVLAEVKRRGGAVTSILTESGVENVQIAIKHLEIPKDLLDSISAKEKATLELEGTVIAADAERQKRTIEGQGTAAAKKQLLDVLRENPTNLQAQALLSLIEMAQGPATTIFPLSTDLTNVLSRVLRGGGSGPPLPDLDQIVGLLTPDQKRALLEKLLKA